MKLSFALLAVVLPAVVPGAAAQSPNPRPTWQFKPSLYMLGSIDESSDLPFGHPAFNVGEASPAANVAAGVDFAREASPDRLRGSLFGLVRSPFDGGDRSLLGAGRVEASNRVGGGGRLTFSDGFKLQARPQLQASDYWGNAATLRGEWSRPSGRGVGVQVGDRRRTLSELDLLSFSRQSAGLGFFAPVAARGRAELSADFQHYSATTAKGQRLVLGAEFGAFTRAGIATLRVAWFEPISDQRRIERDIEPGEELEFGDIGRAEFFEILALQGSYGAVLGDAFFLDPLQSDSDEWDFGRRKQVLTGFVSRRLGARTTAAAFLRLQRKRGPNLLLPEGVEGAAPFADDRFEVRGALRCQVRRRVSLLLQGSYVKNWSERPGLEFFRLLGAFGVQIQF